MLATKITAYGQETKPVAPAGLFIIPLLRAVGIKGCRVNPKDTEVYFKRMNA